MVSFCCMNALLFLLCNDSERLVRQQRKQASNYKKSSLHTCTTPTLCNFCSSTTHTVTTLVLSSNSRWKKVPTKSFICKHLYTTQVWIKTQLWINCIFWDRFSWKTYHGKNPKLYSCESLICVENVHLPFLDRNFFSHQASVQDKGVVAHLVDRLSTSMYLYVSKKNVFSYVMFLYCLTFSSYFSTHPLYVLVNDVQSTLVVCLRR